MAILGKIAGKCAASDPVYTRVGGCDLEPKLINSLLATPLDFKLPITDPAAFNEAIEAGIIAGKIIPIGGIEGATVTGGDLASRTTDYGTNIPVGVNPISVPYNVTNGGMCLEKALSILNGKKMRFFWVDADGMVWGTAISDTEGRGFVGTAYMTRTMGTNQTTPYVKNFNVGYEVAFDKEWTNNFALDLTANIDGLMGIQLEVADGQTRIVNACTGEDVGATIASMAESADLKTIFVQQNGTAATTATIDADTGAVTIAPAGSYRIASAVVLDGLNIVGFAGLNKYVAITGS